MKKRIGSFGLDQIFCVVCDWLELETLSACARKERDDEGVFPRKAYAFLARRHGPKGTSLGEIAEVCGCSAPWIKMAIKEMEAMVQNSAELRRVLDEMLSTLAIRHQPIRQNRELDVGNPTVEFANPLERNEHLFGMDRRIAMACLRVGRIQGGAVEGSQLVLYKNQQSVYMDFAEFLVMAADKSEFWDGIPTGRIILPPRTGKTVLAGQIIAGAGMWTTFIVPGQDLVEQISSDLRAQLPGVPVGVYYGKDKDLVEFGVNVTTYSILQMRLAEDNQLPEPIRQSSLIIADEAHHSMTVERQRLLRDGFDPLAIRLALTATPDYNQTRMLGRFFEHLVHEITISEAAELELIAPLRVYIAEVDIDGSKVEIVGNDFDEDVMGMITSATPFFAGACHYRYAGENKNKRALITCNSRQQAYHLQEYFLCHRPEGTLEPAVIVSETQDRQSLRDAYERGEIDTLIVVRVLVEGWNSPACKLLIDLSPSLSWVWSAQKFFRPLTKWKDKEAAIYMLIPKGLKALPIIPLDLLDWRRPVYEQGELISSARRMHEAKMLANSPPAAQIAKVDLKTRIVFTARFAKPDLDPKDPKQVREVLLSSVALSDESVPLYSTFRHIVFMHPLFHGNGISLLHYCKVEMNRFAYISFLARHFPFAVSELYAQNQIYGGIPTDKRTCEHDLAYMQQELLITDGERHEGFEQGWMALGGMPQAWTQTENPEGLMLSRIALMQELDRWFSTLKPRHELAIRIFFGVGTPQKSTKEIADTLNVTTTRVSQMIDHVLRHLRYRTSSKDLRMIFNTWDLP